MVNFKKSNSIKIDNLEKLEKKFDNKQSTSPKTKTSNKKYHTLYLNSEILEELDLFLKEYGFGEKKSSFIETAIKKEIDFRMDQVASELEEKLKKLKGKK